MAEKLTPKQKAWAEEFAECGNKTEAARRAGYKESSARDMGEENSTKPHITAYLAKLMEPKAQRRIASADDALVFLTGVMNGEVKDQFGLDASLQDRLNAGKELMKRYAAIEPKGEKARSAVADIIEAVKNVE